MSWSFEDELPDDEDDMYCEPYEIDMWQLTQAIVICFLVVLAGVPTLGYVWTFLRYVIPGAVLTP